MALFELLYLNKLKAEKEFPKEDSSKYLFTKIEDADLNKLLKLKNDFYDVKIFKKNVKGHKKRTAFLNQVVDYIKNSQDKNILNFLNQAEQIVSTYDNDSLKNGIKRFTFVDAATKLYYIIEDIVKYLKNVEPVEKPDVFSKESEEELKEAAQKFLDLVNKNVNKIKHGTIFKKDTARITKNLVNQAINAIKNGEYDKFTVEQWKMLYNGLEATINQQDVKHKSDIEIFKEETKEFAKLYDSILNNLKKKFKDNNEKEQALRSVVALNSISDWIKQQKEPKKEIKGLTELFKKLHNDLKPFEKAESEDELNKQLEALTKASEELKNYMN